MQQIDWDIVRRSILGEITQEESSLLNTWKDDKKENQEYYNKLKEYYASKQHREINFDKNKALLFEKLQSKKTKTITFPFGKLMRVAATVAIVVGVALTILYYNPIQIQDESIMLMEASESDAITLIAGSGESYDLNEEEQLNEVEAKEQIAISTQQADYTKPKEKQAELVQKVEYHKLIVPIGKKYDLLLPDGSKVYLNAGTELRFPNRFSDDYPRKVYLKGEAYFEVKKNKKSPFIVVADNLEIKNYGTAYNVNNRDENRIHTTLVNGSISISDGPQGKEFFVKPNQQAVYKKETHRIKISDVNVNQFLGWKNGLFIFENESLENIVKELYLEYNVEFSIVDKTLLSQRFTSYIPRYPDFKEVLKIMESTGKVKFVVEGEKVLIE
jgi:ferric-dicitrate binding protein FerR (iron transport regulator)